MSIQILRGPASTIDNPILEEGQLYLVNDTTPNKLKVGDGQTNLNSLPYIGAEFASDVYRNDGIYPTRTPFTIATAGIPVFSFNTNQIHVDTIYSESQDTIQLMNSILPTDITVNLGDASTRFNYIYGENIISSSLDCTNLTCGSATFNSGINTTNISTTSLTSAGSVIATYKPIIPMQDDKYSIGDSTHRFNSIHTNNLVLNSNTLNYQSDGYIHAGSTYIITKSYLDSTPLKGFSSTQVWPNANRVIISSSDSVLSASSITTTQLGYLSGVTSNIQTQLNGKAASSHSHSYLPLSGGTITGNLTVNKSLTCNSRITVIGTNYPHFYATDPTCTIGKDTSNQLCISGGVIRPGGDGNQNLGNGAHRWATIYAVTGSINTSDRNEKKDIEALDEQYSKDIIMGLKPVHYKFIKNDSDRLHTGFIAQDIEEMLNAKGIDTKDFAAICKWQKTTSDDGVNEQVIENEYSYGLRYEELIAPLVKMVQYQQKEIESMKSQLESFASLL